MTTIPASCMIGTEYTKTKSRGFSWKTNASYDQRGHIVEECENNGSLVLNFIMLFKKPQTEEKVRENLAYFSPFGLFEMDIADFPGWTREELERVSNTSPCMARIQHIMFSEEICPMALTLSATKNLGGANKYTFLFTDTDNKNLFSFVALINQFNKGELFSENVPDLSFKKIGIWKPEVPNFNSLMEIKITGVAEEK